MPSATAVLSALDRIGLLGCCPRGGQQPFFVPGEDPAELRSGFWFAPGEGAVWFGAARGGLVCRARRGRPERQARAATRATAEDGCGAASHERLAHARRSERSERLALAPALADQARAAPAANAGRRARPTAGDTLPARGELQTQRSAGDAPRWFFAARHMQRSCLPLSEWVSPGRRRGASTVRCWF